MKRYHGWVNVINYQIISQFCPGDDCCHGNTQKTCFRMRPTDLPGPIIISQSGICYTLTQCKNSATGEITHAWVISLSAEKQFRIS